MNKNKLTYEQVLKMIQEAESPPVLTDKMKVIVLEARKKKIPLAKIFEWLKELGYTGTIGGIRYFLYSYENSNKRKNKICDIKEPHIRD